MFLNSPVGLSLHGFFFFCDRCNGSRVKSKGHGVSDSMKPEAQVAYAAGPTVVIQLM